MSVRVRRVACVSCVRVRVFVRPCAHVCVRTRAGVAGAARELDPTARAPAAAPATSRSPPAHGRHGRLSGGGAGGRPGATRRRSEPVRDPEGRRPDRQAARAHMTLIRTEIREYGQQAILLLLA